MRKVVLAILLVLLVVTPARGQTGAAQVVVLNRNGNETAALTDGDTVKLRITLPAAAPADTEMTFTFAAVPAPLAACRVAAGQNTCTTEAFPALGWYWDPGGAVRPGREVLASADSELVGRSAPLRVKPRPVVMVHGFNADFHTWDTYLGPGSYLAEIELAGFAVGDGQVQGTLNTGSLADPTRRTNTIAENAAILGQYIANVQKLTGAEQVDLLVHSMGGMISRYYLDRVMTDDNVAQLIILGTPMAGSACANLPAALGLMTPASIEIQPSYMQGVFNQQVYRRNGVPFHALAGTQIIQSIQSPCTSIPSDIVVGYDSFNAIPYTSQATIPLLHVDLNASRDVFDGFVKSHLQTPPGGFPVEPDPAPGAAASGTLQFTRVYTGHVDPGQEQTIIIDIDPNVAVASFGMFDATRSLGVTVTGASGNVIELSAEKNGLILVDDPTAMVTLGYGFANPKPGRWQVTLHSTEKTPPAGADFALFAQFEGGVTLNANTSATLPERGSQVKISATLDAQGQTVTVTRAEALIRKPDGSTERVPLVDSGAAFTGAFTADQAGLYSLEISVGGTNADEIGFDRAAFLSVEAQPAPGLTPMATAVIVASSAALVLALLLIAARVRRGK